jgi:hypothetical protein
VILSREFLQLQPSPSIVTSLLLLDIDNDRRENLIDWPHPAIYPMGASFDFASLPSFANPHVLTESEWHAYQTDIFCEIWYKQSWRGGIILLLLRLLGRRGI